MFDILILYGQYTDQINSNRPGASIGSFSVGKNVVQFEGGSELRTYKHITINIKTVDNLPLLETFIPLLVISTIKDPISISISLTIIPIKK